MLLPELDGALALTGLKKASVFVFDDGSRDGTADVVYRGQAKLQILEGATGQIKWEDNCTSATHIENPLILDVMSGI
jgi:hypothetical protein